MRRKCDRRELWTENLQIWRPRQPEMPNLRSFIVTRDNFLFLHTLLFFYAQFCGHYDTFCIDRKYPKNNKAGWASVRKRTIRISPPALTTHP